MSSLLGTAFVLVSGILGIVAIIALIIVTIVKDAVN